MHAAYGTVFATGRADDAAFVLRTPVPHRSLPPCGGGTGSSGQFDADVVSPGLMVRSHDLRPIQIPQSGAWRLEPWAAPSFETGAHAMFEFSESACACALLRMRRKSRPPLHPQFIFNEIRFSRYRHRRCSHSHCSGCSRTQPSMIVVIICIVPWRSTSPLASRGRSSGLVISHWK